MRKTKKLLTLTMAIVLLASLLSMTAALALSDRYIEEDRQVTAYKNGFVLSTSLNPPAGSMYYMQNQVSSGGTARYYINNTGNNADTASHDNYYDLVIIVHSASAGATIDSLPAETRVLRSGYALRGGSRAALVLTVSGTVQYTLAVLRYSPDNAYVTSFMDLKMLNLGDGYNNTGTNANKPGGEGLVAGSGAYNAQFRKLFTNIFFLEDIVIDAPFRLQIPCNLNFLESSVTLLADWRLKHHYFGVYNIDTISGRIGTDTHKFIIETPNAFYVTGSAQFVSNGANFEKLISENLDFEAYYPELIQEANKFVYDSIPDYLLDDILFAKGYFLYPISYQYEIYETVPDGSGGYIPDGDPITTTFGMDGTPGNAFDLSGAVNRKADENVIMAVRIITRYGETLAGDQIKLVSLTGKSAACRLQQLSLEIDKYMDRAAPAGIDNPLDFLGAFRDFVIDAGTEVNAEFLLGNNGLTIDSETYVLENAVSFLVTYFDAGSFKTFLADSVTMSLSVSGGSMTPTLLSYMADGIASSFGRAVAGVYIRPKNDLFANQSITLSIASGTNFASNDFIVKGMTDEERDEYIGRNITGMYFAEGEPQIHIYMGLDELALTNIRFEIYNMIDGVPTLYEDHPFIEYVLKPEDDLDEGYYLQISEEGFVDGTYDIVVYTYISYKDSTREESRFISDIIVPDDGIGGSDGPERVLFDRNMSVLFTRYSIIEENEIAFMVPAAYSNIDIFVEVANGKSFYDLDMVTNYFPDIDRTKYTDIDFSASSNADFCRFIRSGGAWYMTLDTSRIPVTNTIINVVIIQATNKTEPVVQDYSFIVLGRYQRGTGTDTAGIKYIPDTGLYDLMAKTYSEAGKPYLLSRDAEKERAIFDASAAQLGKTNVNLRGINYLSGTKGLILDGITSFTNIYYLSYDSDGNEGSRFEYLSLAGCGLNETVLGDILMHTTKLRKVNLDNNSFTIVPEMYRTVTEISLNGNKVKNLRGIESNVPFVEILHLQDNHIANFYPLISLTKLKEVYIHNNVIDEALGYDYLISGKPAYYGTDGDINVPNYVSLEDKGVKVYGGYLAAENIDTVTVRSIYNIYGERIQTLYTTTGASYQNFYFRNGKLYGSMGGLIGMSPLAFTDYKVDNIYTANGTLLEGIYMRGNKLYESNGTEYHRYTIANTYVNIWSGSSFARVTCESVIREISAGVFALNQDLYDIYQNGESRVVVKNEVRLFAYNKAGELLRLEYFFDHSGKLIEEICDEDGDPITETVPGIPVTRPDAITYLPKSGDSEQTRQTKAATRKVSIMLDSLFMFDTFYSYIDMPYYVYEGEQEGAGLAHKINIIEFYSKLNPSVSGERLVTVIVNINYQSYTVFKQYEFVLKTTGYAMIVRSDLIPLYTGVGSNRVPNAVEKHGYNFIGWYYYLGTGAYDKERQWGESSAAGELVFASMSAFSSATRDLVVYARWQLEAPEVSATGIIAVYNGSYHYVIPTVTHPFKNEPGALDVYTWQRYTGGVWTNIVADTSLGVRDIADSGQYRVTVQMQYQPSYSINYFVSPNATATFNVVITATRFAPVENEPDYYDGSLDNYSAYNDRDSRRNAMILPGTGILSFVAENQCENAVCARIQRPALAGPDAAALLEYTGGAPISAYRHGREGLLC